MNDLPILVCGMAVLLQVACGDGHAEHTASRPPAPHWSEALPDTGAPYLPGVLSTATHDEGGLHVTPHGETYFWRRLPGEKQQIYVLPTGDTTAEPQRLPFSTDRDESPFLTSDGLTMYFGSERPIPGRPNRGNFDMNVWVTTRPTLDGEWAAPRPLPAPFNEVQAEGEGWPMANASGVFSLDDERYYVGMHRRGDTTSRLYRYRRAAGNDLVDPVQLTGFFEDPRYSVGGATLSPDGEYLFFSSYGAPGGEGGEDLYVSRREGDGEWSLAMPLATLNTADEEAGAYISPDGRTIFFGKAYLLDADEWRYTPWSIYAAPVSSLGLEGLFSDGEQ